MTETVDNTDRSAGTHVLRVGDRRTMKYLILLALIGCAAPMGQTPDGYTGPVHIVLAPERVQESIDAWVAHGNPAGNCEASEDLVWVVLASPADTRKICHLNEALWGCLDGNMIVISTDAYGTAQYEYTLEHELRHWMGGCSLGDVDGNHTNPAYWYPLADGSSVRD